MYIKKKEKHSEQELGNDEILAIKMCNVNSLMNSVDLEILVHSSIQMKLLELKLESQDVLRKREIIHPLSQPILPNKWSFTSSLIELSHYKNCSVETQVFLSIHCVKNILLQKREKQGAIFSLIVLMMTFKITSSFIHTFDPLSLPAGGEQYL
ncbi:hypothetical protein NPIL_402781 [Nephila pilipes]|uniref:Uncharacterized protein n=1 Tax=Nephila pilipes TaxID=299642 RepID=A0A8X6UD88_NEPPI|nr:hypothetical protein NPIL_402781 [Nephila pilipes]